MKSGSYSWFHTVSGAFQVSGISPGGCTLQMAKDQFLMPSTYKNKFVS